MRMTTLLPARRMQTAAHAVLEVEDLKRAPAFPEYPEGGIGADGTITVEVAENSPSTTYVGEALVAAVDPDKGTTLTYTLVGDDADHFELVTRDHDDDANTPEVATRQIMVKEPVEQPGGGWWSVTYLAVDLDHEDDKNNTYSVGLKASDGALDDTITVTIKVTDRNEAPSTPVATSGATRRLPTTPLSSQPRPTQGKWSRTPPPTRTSAPRLRQRMPTPATH